MPLIDTFVAEMEHEAATTRRLLERVPEDRLDFQPHERSMTLARLSGHIAELPLWGTMTLESDELDMTAPSDLRPFEASGRDELLTRFDREMEAFRGAAEGRTDAELAGTWTLRRGDQVLFELPRAAVLRSWVINHLVHHRGQLSVYLRLLDVPVPAIYGPSADERPF